MKGLIGISVALLLAVLAVNYWTVETEKGILQPVTPLTAPKVEVEESISFTHSTYRVGDAIEVEQDANYGKIRITHDTTYTSINASAIATFTALFESAEGASPHKCSHMAVIEVTRTNGETQTYRVLPGHDPDYYEYRTDGKAYRVSRNAFVEAMKHFGIRSVPADREGAWVAAGKEHDEN